MGLQDRTIVRTAAGLEKKYNLAKLAGTATNIETNSENIIKLQNELTNTINTLIINLGDVLDSQSDISLWFYPHIPTTSNLPYTSWVTPSDHIGDLHYAQDYGYVYKYTSDGWIQQTNENLIQAMATTNADLDTTDHERKVFFIQPTPPYDSGDWWLLEDGTLKICQLGRATGEYQQDDFIIANKYTPTIASQDGDIITIKQGQVIKMSDTFASFTDLATGGSTTIAGENITTGVIKSANYVSGTSGTAINLSNGTIDSKNLKLLSNGDLNIGGYIKTDKGILANLQYNCNPAALGQPEIMYGGISIEKAALELNVYVPSNFEIVSAIVRVNLSKTQNIFLYNDTEVINYGKVHNIRLYKLNNSGTLINSYMGIFNYNDSDLSEVLSAFGANGYSAPTINAGYFNSIDIKSNLTVGGTTKLVIKTDDSLLDVETLAGVTAASQQTQIAYATIDIIGYMSN